MTAVLVATVPGADLALAELEAVIERGLATFVEVGRALAAIRDGRRYREAGYATFEAYLEQRWQMARRTGYAYIEAAGVVANVHARAQMPEPPVLSLAQARELATLEPEQQVDLVERFDLASMTSREVADLVRDARIELARRPEARPPERTWPAPIPRPVSVVETDQEALVTLLGIHAVPEPRILDVTANRGVMWRGVPYQPHRLDRDPQLFAEGYTDTVADFRALPFEPASWDVLVFDPPHLSDSGHGVLSGDRRFRDRYGLGGADLKGDSISFLFGPFLDEAKRVLVPDTGIVLAKIADMVHGDAQQFQHIDLVLAARERGFTACDLVIRLSPQLAGLIDPRWREVNHVRKVHSFWLVLRNGPACRATRASGRNGKESTDGGR